MKPLRLASLIIIWFLVAGFSLGDFISNTLTQQEYDKTYKEEYKNARRKGMSEKDADRYAREAAEKKAAKRKDLVEEKK